MVNVLFLIMQTF